MNTNSLSAIPVGVRFMLFSALGFALMTASVKHLSLHHIPVFEIVAARALVSLILSFLDVKRKRISIWGQHKRLLFMRGAVGTVALMCVYYSVSTLPLAEATILQYVYPVFTAILAIIFLKEKLQSSTIICIVFCLIGLFLIVKPELDGTAATELPLLSVCISVFGASCSAIAYVIVRKLSRVEDSSVIIFYFPLVALPVSALLIGDSFVMPDWYLTGVMVLLGIFTQIGQFGLTKAMQTLSAGRASAYSYIQIVFSGLIGIFVFHELPSVWTYLGCVMIVSGALINAFGSQIKMVWLRHQHS